MVKAKYYFERCVAHEPEFLRTMLRKNSPFSVGGCVAMNRQGICPLFNSTLPSRRIAGGV